MRTFCLSFLAGAILAVGVELQADEGKDIGSIFATEEALPPPNRMPLASPDSTSSVSQNRVRKSDIIHASRVERAKQVAQNRLEIEMAARWSGINTARPMVNAGYIFQGPPRVAYVWGIPYATQYGVMYGSPTMR